MTSGAQGYPCTAGCYHGASRMRLHDLQRDGPMQLNQQKSMYACSHQRGSRALKRARWRECGSDDHVWSRLDGRASSLIGVAEDAINCRPPSAFGMATKPFASPTDKGAVDTRCFAGPLEQIIFSEWDLITFSAVESYSRISKIISTCP